MIAAALAAPQVASAQEASVGGSAAVEGPSADGAAAATAEPARSAAGDAGKGAAGSGADVKWIRRYAPERNMVEIGVFGGIFVFNKVHDLYDPDTAPQEPLRRPTADFGVRVAYFPLRILGVEAEFSALPAKYAAPNNGGAFIYGVRAHGILQLPWYRVTPFFAGGYGLMGVSSPASVAGKDVDPVGHIGGGVKMYINRYLAARLDLRNYIGAQAAEQTDGAGHFQATLGLSLTLGRKQPQQKRAEPGDPDRDKDGFLNDVDKCPDTPGIAPDGCPDRDSDGDGFMDSVDQCPTVPGVAPDGCPPKDRDRDGFLDEVDKCPDEPGVAPDGCPIKDTDGDGILDPDDKCVTEPETRNGYQDADGCPDEIPKEVTKFTGVIKGIFFDFNKDTIKKNSAPTLDAAAKIFVQFPDLRVEISGHTDNVGSRDYNVDLATRRAESVKQYLITKGVAGERIKVRGAGPDEPIADNTKASGRAKNRRIEFKILID
ncbi:MAG: OmpA family protein [Myxococcales bacterium]|nr:OmpA family protein [Myxococcales bacterium]